MTHRRNCLCCATSCRYFNDRFEQQSFEGWSEDHGGWEMGDPEEKDGLGIHTTTGGSITCLQEHPDGETDFYLVAEFGATSLSAVLKFVVGNVTVEFSATAWGTWPLRLVRIYDGGTLVREHNMGGYGSDTESYGICFSGGKVIVSGVVSWDIAPPTTSQVTVSAEVSGGEVRLVRFELYRHKSEDDPNCPDCIPRNPCSLLAGQNVPRCLGVYVEPGAPKAAHDAKWCACPNDQYIRRFWGSGYTCTWFERPCGGGLGQFYEVSRLFIATSDVDGTTHYKIVWDIAWGEIRFERDLGTSQPTEEDLYLPLTLVSVDPDSEKFWWPSGKNLIFPEAVKCRHPTTVQFFPLGDGELACADDCPEPVGTLARFCPCNVAGIAGFTASLQGFQTAINYKCPDPPDADYVYHAEDRYNLTHLNGTTFCPDHSNPSSGVYFGSDRYEVNDPYFYKSVWCNSGAIREHSGGWWAVSCRLQGFGGRGDDDNESKSYRMVAWLTLYANSYWWWSAPTYVSDPIPDDWDLCSMGSISCHFDPTCGYDPSWSGTITLKAVPR